MPHTPHLPGDFDVVALWEVVDAQRIAREMTWTGLTKRLAWMSKGAIDRMRETGTATCNHVLPMIEWVGRTPESFTVDPQGAVHELLPDADGRWRWWWHHRELAREIDAGRIAREVTWAQMSDEMGVPAAAIRGIGALRYGPPIGLAMITSRWLQRSAASFMTETPPALTT